MTGALDNIKVIDLSRILAGPWASQMLADMGAQVIKVEKPIKGDDTRFWGPPFIKRATEQQPPQAAYFHSTNRNKQSIAIDITKKEGQQIIKELISKADVLIENYKVGGLEKYGLDYESIKASNPSIIYCSITGFGQKGPSAHKAGYDAMIQGEGGLMSLTGEPTGEPMKVGVALVDIMTGLYSCNGILAALLARGHTKSGQHIDIALLDVQMATLANQGMNYLATGKNPSRLGNGHPNIVPYQTFATLDGSIILAIGNDRQFNEFCKVAGCSELGTDERFLLNENRVLNRAILINTISDIMSKVTTSKWIELLESVAIPCGPVNNLQQVFDHPQTKYRKMIRQVPNKNGMLVDTIASPINLSDTPLQYKNASPDLGQHSRQILAKNLNYSEQKIDELMNDGVIT